MLVSWVKRSLMPPFGTPPNFGFMNFLLLTSLCLVFYWRLHLLTFRRGLSKGHKLSLTSACCVGSRTIFVSARSVSAHKISHLQFSQVIFSLVIQCLLSYLFIYLFIYSISYLQFNHVTLQHQQNAPLVFLHEGGCSLDTWFEWELW